jgi:oligopeptide/dipeptide ABC transporter ATP-binding protein
MNETSTRPTLLETRDVKVWFPIRRGVFSRTVGHVRAVDGVSVALAAGETLGLVGESGCGKSTLARAVLRLERVRSGSVLFRGEDLLLMKADRMRRARRSIQMVFQDPFSSLNPRLTVLDTLTEGMLEHGVVQSSGRKEAAVSLLSEVGMASDALHRYPHEFSGGQRQRIGIARALSLRPSLVVCDEAVSALDVSVQAQVLNLLMDLRARHELSYLFISHDMSVVRHISHRVAVMYMGRIVETGPTEELLSSPVHPYTRALLAAVPRAGGPRLRRAPLNGSAPSAASEPAGCPFADRCPFAIADCRSMVPELKGIGEDSAHLAACIRSGSI